jgi:hypothetical protein
MPGWVDAFVVIAGIAILIQSIMLVAMFFELKNALRQMTTIANEFQNRMGPILLRTTRILDDSEGKIQSIMSDASEITRVARSQAQKVDRVFTDALERLRTQIIRADQILTGTLEVIEETGSKFKTNVWKPVQQASAIIKGIKTGIEVLRSSRNREEAEVVTQDEELFI